MDKKLTSKKSIHSVKDSTRPMNSLWFKLMSFEFALRDKKKPPMKKINNAEIKTGERVLDYGCGPGGFTIAASEKVGEKGKVYAADIHPLALKSVQKMSKKIKLNNIETILTKCETNLPENSIDIILLFDIIHAVEKVDIFLDEFYSVLNSWGRLAVDDHHMSEEEIIETITSTGQFKYFKTNDTVVLFQVTNK